nr:DUF1289 domain-containing protein [Photobacterium leiognathi]
MEQKDFFDIPSPCKRICEVNNRGYCKGCYRSRQERLYWLQMTDDQKHQVLDICRRREQQVRRRHRVKVQQELDKAKGVEEDPQQSLF